MFKEFKEFAMRGSVFDMAIGIVIGVAFGVVIASFVADILMPPIGLLLGNVDFTNLFATLREGMQGGPYVSLEAAQADGAVTINYGKFINSVISFLIVAFAIFLMVRQVNRMKREEPAAPDTKECPHCLSSIPIKATRCAYCTSEVVGA